MKRLEHIDLLSYLDIRGIIKITNRQTLTLNYTL